MTEKPDNETYQCIKCGKVRDAADVIYVSVIVEQEPKILILCLNRCADDYALYLSRQREW